MSVIIPEIVSSEVFLFGVFEEGLTRMVLEHLDEGMVFVDVGAHLGYYTLLASSIVGSSGQVHSFEPTPSIYEILHRNTETKHNVIINNCALYSENTDLAFNDYGLIYSAFNSFTTARLGKKTLRRAPPNQIMVKAVKLDEYVRAQGIKKVDFVKIDAESTEYEVLEGMSQIITRMKPIISVEVGDMDIPGVRASREVILYLLGKGYEAYEFSNGNIFRHNLMNHYEYDNILFIPK